MAAGTGLAAGGGFSGLMGSAASMSAGQISAAGDMATQFISDLGGSILNSSAVREAGLSDAYQLSFNADLAEMFASETVRQGRRQAKDIKGYAKRLIGSQRAAAASQNVEVDSGSAAELQQDTVRQSSLDALEAENNAWRRAWGLRLRASVYRGQAEQSNITSKYARYQSLVGSSTKAVTSITGAVGGFGF